ncbi:MAG: HIRAN domain-containing protein [Muribaculaceae bacterium]|nr:HIRAN domain-containing protein [Muribaculaceae bacterium]
MNDDEIWDELEVGTQIALICDRNNKHDRNAVALALADDYDGCHDDFDFDFILGYVPRTDNAELAAMMDVRVCRIRDALLQSYAPVFPDVPGLPYLSLDFLSCRCKNLAIFI